MSTPDQPGGLTRKQLRELRSTGMMPIVSPDDDAVDADKVDEPTPEPVDVGSAAREAETDAPAQPEESDAESDQPDGDASESPAAEFDAPPPPPPPVPSVHLPKAATPVAAPTPPADAQVDLGVAPLTRRQAREQERIRTASVPVITPDLLAAHAAASAQIASDPARGSEQPKDEPPVAEDAADAGGVAEIAALFGGDVADDDDDDEEIIAEVVDDEPDTEPELIEDAEPESVPPDESVVESTPESDIEPDAESAEREAEVPAPVEDRPVLQPAFGAALLETPAPVDSVLTPSFDELIARNTSSTGSVATSNALILSQTPSGSPLVAPITATGEVLITGSLALPDGLGSRGHAPGVTDGKDIDAVLIDGELPPTSSPTPIAASAAISTVKGTGEIIRPPAPEKGNKLMLTLAITAGVLAIALVGVLILAFVTGVF